MSAIVRYHIQRGDLYLGDDRHATDDVPLWCEWGDPFVCGFLDHETADYWRRQNDGSRMRVSIDEELVTSRDEAIAAERARIIALIEARQADVEEALSKVKYQQYYGRIYDEGQLEGKRDMCELLIAELRGEK